MTDPTSGLLARSDLLGADPRNTDHAGGTICTKGTEVDRVTGQPVDLVRVEGPILVSCEAARILIEQDMGGDVVSFSSRNSVSAGPSNIAYSSTEADQAHLLAAELGPHQIRVNGINPDHVADAVFALTGDNRTRTSGVSVPVDSGVAADFLR